MMPLGNQYQRNNVTLRTTLALCLTWFTLDVLNFFCYNCHKSGYAQSHLQCQDGFPSRIYILFKMIIVLDSAFTPSKFYTIYDPNFSTMTFSRQFEKYARKAHYIRKTYDWTWRLKNNPHPHLLLHKCLKLLHSIFGSAYGTKRVQLFLNFPLLTFQATFDLFIPARTCPQSA